ncbi:MAG: hydrogenase expression/formation protein HypE [Ignavibacteria bacterium]|nr:hydrogenase expression/formation protein HypE [Ignavibacteria bacterium]
MQETTTISNLSCPLPISDYKQILLGHGSGGTLSHNLIQSLIRPVFNNSFLDMLHDGAVFDINGARLAFTTDSYVVRPIFFPNSDIGELAVNGTINDLAMCGAKPLFLSAGLIIEEGFEILSLERILQSMQKAALEAGVQIVTGDTKVVEKGKGDGIYINVSGIGSVEPDVEIAPKRCREGDVIILNGRIAEHGIAIMSAREGFEFESEIVSDTAPLNSLVETILNISKHVHVLRDPTRGGIASALNEIAEDCNLGILIDENKILISESVKGACEILGFDPLYVANEGKLLVILPEHVSEPVLTAMRNHPLGKESQIIGQVTSENAGKVIMKTSIGTHRIVDMLSGEQLPRIC